MHNLYRFFPKSLNTLLETISICAVYTCNVTKNSPTAATVAGGATCCDKAIISGVGSLRAHKRATESIGGRSRHGVRQPKQYPAAARKESVHRGHYRGHCRRCSVSSLSDFFFLSLFLRPPAASRASCFYCDNAGSFVALFLAARSLDPVRFSPKFCTWLDRLPKVAVYSCMCIAFGAARWWSRLWINYLSFVVPIFYYAQLFKNGEQHAAKLDFLTKQLKTLYDSRYKQHPL